jgi:uncharacterized delta-60 repeat protein
MKTCLRLFVSFTLIFSTMATLQGQAGSIDLSFGNNGYVTANLGFNGGQFNSLVAQADGKILAIGQQYGIAIKVLRYHADGQLDTGFGTDGITTINASTTSSMAGGLLPNGKIVVVFTKNDPSGLLGSILSVARLHANGIIDNDFGTDGIVTVPNAGSIRKVSETLHMLDNGDLIVVGAGPISSKKIFAVKVKANGTLDDSFGVDGVRSLNTFDDVDLIKSAPQANNRIVNASMGHNAAVLNVHQIFDNGSKDPSFGSDGTVQLDVQEYSTVGGVCGFPNGNVAVAVSAAGEMKFTVTSFGGDGSSSISLSESSTATGIALQQDGKIIVGGMAGLGEGEDYAIARFNGDGTPDQGFGNNGVAKHLDPQNNHCATTMLKQSDGNMVVAGFTQMTGLGSMTRYLTGTANGVADGMLAVADFSISPNPAYGSGATASFALAEGSKTTVAVYDMTGKLLSASTANRHKGMQSAPIPLENLPAGTYLVSVRTANGTVTEKLVRSK